MKKTRPILLVILFLSCVFVFSVSAENSQSVEITNPSTPNAMPVDILGITVNTIKIEEVKITELSKEIQDKVIALRKERGFAYFELDNGEYLLAVYAGEKRSGGYGISVIQVEDNEGITNVLVKETSPEKGQMVTMAITYPFSIVKLKGVTPNFNVTTTADESLYRVSPKAFPASPTVSRQPVPIDKLRVETLEYITSAWSERLLQLQKEMENIHDDVEKKLYQEEWNYIWKQWKLYQEQLQSLKK